MVETTAPHVSHYELLDNNSLATVARFTRLHLAIEAADRAALGSLLSGVTTPRALCVFVVYSNGDGYPKYHNSLCK